MFIQKIARLKSAYSRMSTEAKAGVWFSVCNFINKGISMVVVPLYTRLLTQEEYGTYSIFLSWLNIFIIVGTLEISWGHYPVGITKYDKDKDRYTSSVLGLSNVITLSVFIIYICASSLFNKYIGLPTHVVIWIFIYLLFYPAWEFWAIRQRFSYKYIRLVIITLFVAVLSPIIGVAGIVFFNMQSDAPIFSKLSIQCVIGIIITVSFLCKSPQLFNRQYWKEVFMFNIALIPYLLSTVLLNQTNRIMINSMIGAKEAAIYSVAFSVGMILFLLNTAIGDSIVPWIYRNLKEERYSLIEPTVNKLLLIVGALNVLLVLFAPEVIRAFAPIQYKEAIWIIPPIAASVFFIFIFQRYVNIELYYESTVSVSAVSIIIAILNIGLNYIFLGKWGYLSAGYVTLFCYILFCITHFIILRRIFKSKCNNVQIFTLNVPVKIAVAFLILIFAVTLLYEYSFLRYLLIAIIFVFIYRKRTDIYNLIKQ